MAKTESPTHHMIAQTAAPMGGNRAYDGHAASMEGAHGVPAKIEEGVEPD